MESTSSAKEMTSAKENLLSIDEKIDVATQTLERNIAFVVNCDNKTSIVLTAVGVLLTIILTNEGAKEIIRIVRQCTRNVTFCDIFFIVCSLLSVGILLFGMYNLISVIVARISESARGIAETPSRIFFTGIHNNGTFSDYSSKFDTMTKDELLNELVAQIYINADIAVKKYSLYNKGLKCTAFGFVLCVALFLIGDFLY